MVVKELKWEVGKVYLTRNGARHELIAITNKWVVFRSLNELSTDEEITKRDLLGRTGRWQQGKDPKDIVEMYVPPPPRPKLYLAAFVHSNGDVFSRIAGEFAWRHYPSMDEVNEMENYKRITPWTELHV